MNVGMRANRAGAAGDEAGALRQTVLLARLFGEAEADVGLAALVGSLNAVAAGVLVLAEREGVDVEGLLQVVGVRVARAQTLNA